MFGHGVTMEDDGWPVSPSVPSLSTGGETATPGSVLETLPSSDDALKSQHGLFVCLRVLQRAGSGFPHSATEAGR